MGGGLARQIKEKYPNNFNIYKEKCERNSPKNLLGCCLFQKEYDGKYIANLFGQYSISNMYRMTDYEGFYKSIIDLRYALENEERKMGGNKLSLAFPVNIGCGLGGGSWSIILPIILSVFEKDDRTIIFYEQCIWFWN